MRSFLVAGLAVALIGAGAIGIANAQQPVAQAPGAQAPAAGRGAAGPSGEAIFKARCAACHDPAQDRAPGMTQLATHWPEEIVAALKTGVMQPMAAGLSGDEINAVATYLTGRRPGVVFTNLDAEGKNACPAGSKFNPAGPAWSGWSPDKSNDRRAVSTTINAANVGRVQVKWAFALQGGRYGQPAPVGNRVFAASSSGRAYALDKETGCVAWAFTAKSGGIRVPASIGRNAKAPSGYAAYLGDFGRNVYALDANSGKEIWSVRVDDHPRGVLTGAPALYNDVLYVVLSAFEESTANAAYYQCCTARGGVAAIDVKTGKILWKEYVLPPAQPFKKNAAGTQMFGPAGAMIWSAPTIDAKRGALYVATGDGYTDVDEDFSDAIVAFDLKTGKIRWHHQVTEDDNFLSGCAPARPGANCPTVNGPDHDFGASPIIKTLKTGKSLVLSGQKSGQVYAMDPDKDGAMVWQARIGRGSALGGVEWGMAADDDHLYVATADRGSSSVTAFRLADGTQVWQHKAPEAKCSFTGACRNGYSAPLSVANGVVYAPNQDGHIRAFEAKSGTLLWDFDSAARKYQTVNGVKDQRGGNFDGSGISFAGPMAFVMAGYNGASSSNGPDNVLLALSVDGK